MGSRMASRLATARPARILAAAIILVDGCPGPVFCLLFLNSTFLVALGDMIGLALLLVSIFRFVATRHDNPPVQFSLNDKAVPEFPGTLMRSGSFLLPIWHPAGFFFDWLWHRAYP
jgi:hypothetical protein